VIKNKRVFGTPSESSEYLSPR